ncbi:MAG: hypothetical protein RL240_545 [Planctomycetota bacterium]
MRILLSSGLWVAYASSEACAGDIFPLEDFPTML